MAYIVGGVLIAAVALLVFASHNGHVQLRSCCGVADPRRDLRMRAAFTDEESPCWPLEATRESTPTHITGTAEPLVTGQLRRPAEPGRL